MKRLLFSAVLFLSVTLLKANHGDTIFVKTFTFDSISTRRATFDNFPTGEHTWEKILMYYTIKCRNSVGSGDYPCGEWDYTALSNIYTHSNRKDSVQYPHKKYTLNNNDFTTFSGTTTPKYHKKEIAYNNTNYSYINHLENTILTDETNFNAGITAQNKDYKIYMLYDAATLGIVAGEISEMDIATETGTGIYSIPCKLKVATSNESSLSQEIVNATTFTNIFNSLINYDQSTGKIHIAFNTPISYDGISNLIFEFSCPNNNGVINFLGTVAGTNVIMYTNSNDNYLDFEGFSYIDAPSAIFPSSMDEITITCWAYGDPALQPQNNSLFYAIGNNNTRQLNVHYPWGSGAIFWDTGDDGNGYDRIEKTAATSEYEGKWNHLAFTKNCTDGTMKIYINGVLWHSGTGKTKLITNINKFIIGNINTSNGNENYDGYIDDFCVWNKELSESEIQSIMYNKPTNLLPFWNNLLAYYDFDEGTEANQIIIDKSDYNHNAEFLGTLLRKSYNGEYRFKNFELSNTLPQITLHLGEFTSTNTADFYLDSVLMPLQIVREFYNVDIHTIGLVGTNIYYPTYESYTNVGGTTTNTNYQADITITNSNLTYWEQPFDLVVQLQNYVTPYGIGLSLGTDGFTFVLDVTDYQEFLTGSVELEAHNWQELLDLTFAFIEGTPPHNVLQFDQIYRGYYGHADIADNKILFPRKTSRNANAQKLVVKTRTTGHGMESSYNCAEFCFPYHRLYVEGVQRYQWQLKTECGNNPIYPQGGTWIYDRAGWCPGQFADTYDWDITNYVTDPDSILIDYGMQKIGQGAGSYQISTQLIQYSTPNFQNDAAIEAVIKPNNSDIYSRFNPICSNPEIIIKNTGANNLTSLQIEYGIDGNYNYSYTWTGNLGFLKTQNVVLPNVDYNDFSSTVSNATYNFNVRISQPNNTNDEYEFNNIYKTRFTPAQIFNYPAVFMVKTNNFGNETHYTVTDHNGNVVIDRDGLSSNTEYLDTIYNSGCYDIQFYDRGGDGLHFWHYQNQDGTGYAKLKKVGGVTVFKSFNADFGNFIHYQFVLNTGIISTPDMTENDFFEVFPNPNDGNFIIRIDIPLEAEETIQILDMQGRIVKIINNTDFAQNETNISLNNLAKGFYFIKLDSKAKQQIQKLVVE